jgi:hypothetical protein
MKTKSELFDKVEAAIDDAILIAWDGCHKMYLAMDAKQAAWFRAEYPHVVQDSPDRMLDALMRWWDESCWLKFVNAVSTNEDDPNAGFVSLIEQGAGEDDDMVECDRCGDTYDEAKGDGWCGLCPSCADDDNED